MTDHREKFLISQAEEALATAKQFEKVSQEAIKHSKESHTISKILLMMLILFFIVLAGALNTISKLIAEREINRSTMEQVITKIKNTTHE